MGTLLSLVLRTPLFTSLTMDSRSCHQLWYLCYLKNLICVTATSILIDHLLLCALPDKASGTALASKCCHGIWWLWDTYDIEIQPFPLSPYLSFVLAWSLLFLSRKRSLLGWEFNWYYNLETCRIKVWVWFSVTSALPLKVIRDSFSSLRNSGFHFMPLAKNLWLISACHSFPLSSVALSMSEALSMSHSSWSPHACCHFCGSGLYSLVSLASNEDFVKVIIW